MVAHEPPWSLPRNEKEARPREEGSVMSKGRPSDNEAEFAARKELANRRDAHRRKMAALAEHDRERLRSLHWMHCPKCGAGLEEVIFRGVRVDKCFACGGVYLDDGELEQLAGKPGWLEAMLRFFR
jgi:hypothetical protein